MSEVIDLSLVRKEKSNAANTWSVADALKEALRMVESGEVPAHRVYVAFGYRNPDNPDQLHRANVQCMDTNLEAMGLLQQHIIDLATGAL